MSLVFAIRPGVCNFALVENFGDSAESASFGGLRFRGERILLLAKAKSSKNFCALRARFCDFAFCV